MQQAMQPRPFVIAGSWRRTLVATALLVAAVLWLYRDTVVAMVAIWSRSDTFAHAFLVPPIAAWLVWRERAELARRVPSPRPWLLLPLALAGLLWLLGDLGSVNSATQFALVGLLVLAVLALVGIEASRPIWFALGFLFFAVPFGEFLLPQLMAWTADFTVLALRASGIPVYRDGLQFVIPSGRWSVVEACSGVRYLIASAMVGALYAHLNYRSTRRRLVFVGISLLVPLVANWVRAYMIVMIGHLSGNQLAVGVDHLVYGWVFFGVVMFLMFVIGARWTEAPVAADASPAASGSRAPAAAGRRLSPAAWAWPVFAAAVAIVALPQWAVRNLALPSDAGPVPLEAPAPAAGWQAAGEQGRPFTPAFRNPVASVERSYAKDGRTVGLYLAYYRHQDYARKLVNSDNVLVPSGDERWVQTGSSSGSVSLGGRSVGVRAGQLRSMPGASAGREDRRQAWQLYWVNGTLTASDIQAKAYGALHRLMGRGDDAAVIVVDTEEFPDNAAQAVLAAFLRDHLAAIEAQLGRARASAGERSGPSP
jgi:exosortase A